LIKTFKYKLKPTSSQSATFKQWVGTCRFLYNLMLGYKIDLYKQHQINLSKYDAQKQLTDLRKYYP